MCITDTYLSHNQLVKILFLCRLHVSCSYSVSSNSLPIKVQVFTLPPPFPETQPGPLTLELQIAKGMTPLAGVSGLQSKSSLLGHEDPNLVTRHLSGLGYLRG